MLLEMKTCETFVFVCFTNWLVYLPPIIYLVTFYCRKIDKHCQNVCRMLKTIILNQPDLVLFQLWCTIKLYFQKLQNNYAYIKPCIFENSCGKKRRRATEEVSVRASPRTASQGSVLYLLTPIDRILPVKPFSLTLIDIL